MRTPTVARIRGWQGPTARGASRSLESGRVRVGSSGSKSLKEGRHPAL
jgi:hypothetical protein